ncbi:MAG: GDP-mannose 4,6-dehydratase, partial [Pseudomonadota bacterium]
VFASNLVRNYRSRFGLYACSAIMYNHESEWRGPNFVTRKITLGAANIKCGNSDLLKMGNIDGVRDWSYAGDFIDAMWFMMTADQPRDYVLASGKLHSVRDVLNIAFGRVGLKWEDYVQSEASFARRKEGSALIGDTSLIRKELGWTPKLEFEDFITLMVDKDMERVEAGVTDRTEVVVPTEHR